MLQPYQRQALAIRRYQKVRFGGALVPNFVLRRPGTYITPADSMHNLRRLAVEKLFGEGYYVQITKIEFHSFVGGEDIEYVVSRMPFLRSIKIQRSELDNDTLTALARMKNLNHVTAIHCELSNSDVAVLCQSSTIAYLCLNGNPITNKGIKSLEELASLKELELYWTDVDEDGITALKTARPDVNIDFWNKAPPHAATANGNHRIGDSGAITKQ